VEKIKTWQVFWQKKKDPIINDGNILRKTKNEMEILLSSINKISKKAHHWAEEVKMLFKEWGSDANK